MDAVTIDEVETAGEQEDSRTVQARVLAARERQLSRYRGEKYYCNANMARGRARAAAIAHMFVDFNNLPKHSHRLLDFT